MRDQVDRLALCPVFTIFNFHYENCCAGRGGVPAKQNPATLSDELHFIARNGNDGSKSDCNPIPTFLRVKR